MQFTSDTLKPTLRKTAKQMAHEEYDRQVKKKQKAGYVEAAERTEAVQLEKMKSGLDFDHLPKAFAPAKPIREISHENATRWDRAGLLIKQRKRDGMRHYIVAGKDGQLRAYSRGMDDMTAHFERLIQDLSLPPGTILDAEFVVTTRLGQDDFKAVSEICRSKPDRAKRTMVGKEHNGSVVQFVVFDLLFYDRLPTWQLPYAQRYTSLLEAMEKARPKTRMVEFSHVVVMPTLTMPLKQAITRVHKRKWEGLVLWRKDQATQVHLNRSPKRCNCYKFKPMREGDFIALGFEFGKGRNGKVMGALNLALYTPRQPGVGKKWKHFGNVGTGFSDQQRVEALRWRFPCVVEVRYEKMSDKGLRFPSFLRLRPDMDPKECVFNG